MSYLRMQAGYQSRTVASWALEMPKQAWLYGLIACKHTTWCLGTFGLWYSLSSLYVWICGGALLVNFTTSGYSEHQGSHDSLGSVVVLDHAYDRVLISTILLAM